MDLTGRLSNRDLTTLLQRLIARNWRQAPPRRTVARGVAPDGRRPFGSVSEAIVKVLAQADAAMRVRDIHSEVERVLGGSVSTSSVKNHLHKGSRGANPVFERRGLGGYVLR